MATGVTRRSLARALVSLVVTTAVYLVMNGAQIFETVLIVPAWTAAPPASLGLFQGAYGLDFKAFWIAVHSIHELTFIAALIACWKLPSIRWALLELLGVHVAVRVWTIAYFAPTIIAFQGLPVSTQADHQLVAQAARWRTLNLLRVLVFAMVNLALFPLIHRVGAMLYAGRGSS